MGGDNAHFTAPDKHRQRRFQQLVQLFVERGLVDNDDALTATQVRWATGERDDAEAGVGKLDGVGLDVLVVFVLFPEAFLDFAGGIVEHTRPHRAGLDIFDGHGRFGTQDQREDGYIGERYPGNAAGF